MHHSVRALAASAMFASCATAQVERAPFRVLGPGEQLVNVEQVRRLHVTSLGRIVEDDGGGYRACDVLSSHTDSDFGAGSYIGQFGFAEDESEGISFTIDAADFPIKIDLHEILIITGQTTNQEIVIEWSVSFYEGTPTSGTLIQQHFSDDLILPHIHIPPGPPQGVHLQFSVDPDDPEQIILDDNGSHTFTVAFTIEEHNNQTQDPCIIPPPKCCNGFPCTDTSGLASATGNWLEGVDCGPNGCPPNGGWARFSQLVSGCRPSGDWVQRVTWSSIDCAPGVGACCLPNGTCDIMLATDCTNAGGTYRGDGTSCDASTCTGACCLSDGTCIITDAADCAAQNGDFNGLGVTCEQADCQPAAGACCFSNGFCLNLTEVDCGGAGGTWQGPGTACANGNECPTGACCLTDGTCVVATEGDCVAQGGTFRGVGVECANADCPPPTGACCFDNGFCLELSEAECLGVPGAVWNGPGTLCADGCGCPDCDGDGICDEDEDDCNQNGTPDDCEGTVCAADLAAPFGTLNIFDFLAFQTYFGDSHGCADLAAPFGQWNIFDFLAFQTAFGNGC